MKRKWQSFGDFIHACHLNPNDFKNLKDRPCKVFNINKEKLSIDELSIRQSDEWQYSLQEFLRFCDMFSNINKNTWIHIVYVPHSYIKIEMHSSKNVLKDIILEKAGFLIE